MIRFQLDGRALVAVVEQTQLQSVSSRYLIGLGIRDSAEKIRTRAIRNVSGYPVSYEGGAFRVQVKTGALKGAIESRWPHGDLLTARVFVNGSHTSVSNTGGYPSRPVPVSRYAAAIEFGHGPIDLKKTMMGKTVPFFGARAQNAQGPYAERGLVSAGGGQFISSQPRGDGKKALVYDRRRTASGGSYFIAFRKVGKKGWVIPEAKPRPFMAAARDESRPDIRRLLGARVRQLAST